MTKSEAVPDGRREDERVAVVVLGMHRSGTSAFARVLSLLGCDLPKGLMKPDASNEPGHWESMAVARLNDALLESAGSKWDDWSQVNPGWLQSPKATSFKERAGDLLEQEFGTSSLFVLKDPRICRIAPFWLDVLKARGVRPVALVPLRNPLEVSASLEARNGIHRSLGHLMWLRHVLDAEYGTRGMARSFAGYEGLLKNWPAAAQRMAQAYGFPWPRFSPRVGEEIDAFLSGRHRHHRESAEALLGNPLQPSWLQDAYRILNGWAAHGENAAEFAELDAIRRSLTESAPAFERLASTASATARRVKQLEMELAEANATASAEGARLALLDQRLARTESELAQRRLEAEETALLLTQRERELELVAEQLAGTGERAEDLAARLAERDAATEALAAQLEAGREELARKAREADDAVARLANHSRELAVISERLRAREQEIATGQAETEKLGLQIEEKANEAAELRTSLDSEKRKAASTANDLQGRLKDRFGEIATLTRMYAEAEEKGAQMQQVAAREIGRSIRTLLEGRGAKLLPERVRSKLQIRRLRQSGLLDPDWYLATYPDVKAAGIDPYWHFVTFGYREGREPNGALAGLRNGPRQADR